MAVIDSATRTSSINTVSQASGVQAQNAAAETDVSNTADRLAANRELLNTTPTDGNHTLKEMNIAQAQLDVKLSQTEFIVYDGELSSANIELQAIKAQITGKESGLATEQAKTEIKTSINANGEAEFITHSGMKVVTDVNKGGHTTKIYNPAGEQLMQIEGDPHVNMLKDADGNNGYDFHFGDDSTLKLEDGAEITFNTKQVSPGVYYTVGLYVAAGDNVMHTGMDTSDSEASRKSDIVKVEASTVHKRGDTTQGAVMMGLKGDGQILMQTGDNQWNEIKDETWDGYLANKSFDGQAGAKVDFKPQTIMTSGDLASIKLEITQLKGQQAKYESRVATLTPLKSMAENNLDTANSNLATYQSMDDSAFVDNGANRKETEQKSLELSKRANNLGSFMALSNLVSDANFKQLGVSQGDMVSGAINADREYGENNIRYIDQGLQHSADRNSGTSNLVNSLSHLADISDFEEKSIQNDRLIPVNH